MKKRIASTAFTCFGLLLMLATTSSAQAQDTKTPYPSMAPLDQYLMERSAEITLARTAAPASISEAAEVMVLGKQGYEVADRGSNGFVCMVARSWAAGFDDPEFWNPKPRSPICFNPAGARSYIPLIIKKTDLALAGRSKDQMAATIGAAVNKKELPAMEPGAMCYMLSKQGHLNGADGPWHPHLMFFLPLSDAGTWGAGLPGSQVFEDKDETAQVTTFMVVVRKWSDGTFDMPETH